MHPSNIWFHWTLKQALPTQDSLKRSKRKLGGERKKKEKKQRGEGERERLQIVSHNRKASVEVTGKLAHETSLIKEMFPSKTIN